MAAVGGSIESITIRGRYFPVSADADASITKGGLVNDEEGVNGDGTKRQIKRRVSWKVSGIEVEIDHDRDDLGFLWEIAAEKGYVPMTITLASGHVYQGRGEIQGDIEASTQSTTCGLTLGGPGQLELQ